ncbi:MAG: chromate transporter [Bacteroidales bacterium]|jgi:chromate transporter
MNIYLEIFLTFSKVGAFTIGGGWAMIPLIEKEVVDKKKWIKREEFIDMIALSQSLPGILAVNFAVFIGYRLKKVKGSFVSLIATILPSFLIILSIAIFFSKFQDNQVVVRIFKGIRPAVVALIAVPVFTTAKAAKLNLKNMIVPILATVLIAFNGISPVYIILAVGIGGFLYGQIERKYNNKNK